MRNREITFIVRMRNEARQAVQGMSGDLRGMAREAGRAAAANRTTSQAVEGVRASAGRAAQAVQGMNTAVGGAVAPLNRARAASRSFMGELMLTIKQMILFGTVMAGFAVITGFTTALIEQSAAWQMLGARIGLVTKNGAEAKAVQEELYQIAQRTYAPTEAVGTLYFRMAQSLGAMGYSQREVLTLTEMIGQTMVISGAKTEEAAGALIQFSQALASNRFSGDELRSVLEQAPALAQTLVAGLTKTAPDMVKKYGMDVVRTTGEVTTRQRELMVGALRDAGKAGELTTKTITDALLTQVDSVQAKFATIPILVPLAFQNVKNAFQKELAEIDMMFNLNGGLGRGLLTLASDIIPLLSDAITPLADAISMIGSALSGIASVGTSVFSAIGIGAGEAGNAMQGLARGLGVVVTWLLFFKAIPALFGLIGRAIAPAFAPLGAAMAAAGPIIRGVFSAALLALRGNFIGVGLAAGAASGGIRAMGAALTANPIGALLVALQLAIGLWMMFKDKTFEVGGSTVSIAATVGEAWERTMKFLGSIFVDFGHNAMRLWRGIGDFAQGVASWFTETWVGSVNNVAGAYNWLKRKAGEIFAGIAGFAGRFMAPVFRWLSSIPSAYANVVRIIFNTLGNFYRQGLNMLGSAVGVFNADWGNAIKNAGANISGALSGAGEGMAGFIENAPSMVLNGMNMVSEGVDDLVYSVRERGSDVGRALGEGAIEAWRATGVGEYWRNEINEAFGGSGENGFWAQVEARTAAERARRGAVAGATPDLDAKDNVQIEDRSGEDEEGADRAAKERQRRVKEMTSAIKGLTSAYNPYLASLAKDDESMEKLNDLRAKAALDAVAFSEALERAGMTMENWRTVVFQIEAGLKSSEVNEFLGKFAAGADIAADKAERLADAQLAGRLRNVAVGTAEYSNMLRQLGWSAEQAQEALARFDAGLSLDNVREFFSTYAEGWDRIEARTANIAPSTLVDELIAARDAGGLAWTSILTTLRITADEANAAIARAGTGFSVENMDAARGAIESFLGTYDPLLAQRAEDARLQKEITDLETLRVENTPAFTAALKAMGISQEEYNEALRRGRETLNQSRDDWSSMGDAARDYAADIQKNGISMKQAWGNAFKGMEDALVNFVQTGKLDFKAMVDSMIADLIRLAAQKMIFKAITTAMGMPMADGGAFGSGGLTPFATGGTFANKVVSSPTFFSFAKQGQKKLGVMGEAGPEAIMPLTAKAGGLMVTAYGADGEEQIPLKRGPNGRLGIDREALQAARAFAKGGAFGASLSGAKRFKTEERPMPTANGERFINTMTPKGVLPVTSGGGAGGIINLNPTITVNVEGGSGDKEEQNAMGANISAAMVQALKGMVLDVLHNEKRPGGALAA